MRQIDVRRILLDVGLCISVHSYRPADQVYPDYLEAFNSSSSRIVSNKNVHILVVSVEDIGAGVCVWWGGGGQLNGAICKYPMGYRRRHAQHILNVAKEQCLVQVVNVPARQDKILDLLFTNSHYPVNRVKRLPSITTLSTLNMI